MKDVSGIVLLAIVLTLAAVYILYPLNAGAVGLVALICMGISTLLVKSLQRLIKRRKQ